MTMRDGCQPGSSCHSESFADADDLHVEQVVRELKLLGFSDISSIEQYHREDNERPRGCKIVSLLPD
jgi:hypothetical protein